MKKETPKIGKKNDDDLIIVNSEHEKSKLSNINSINLFRSSLIKKKLNRIIQQKVDSRRTKKR